MSSSPPHLLKRQGIFFGRVSKPRFSWLLLLLLLAGLIINSMVTASEAAYATIDNKDNKEEVSVYENLNKENFLPEGPITKLTNGTVVIWTTTIETKGVKLGIIAYTIDGKKYKSGYVSTEFLTNKTPIIAPIVE